MRKFYFIIYIVLLFGSAYAQNKDGFDKNYVTGSALLDVKFDKDTRYHTGTTTDATVENHVLSVRGLNWFPFHYIPSEGMRDYVVTVNCRLDKTSEYQNGNSTGLNITKTILFEGYSPDDDHLKGIFLSQVMTKITDSLTHTTKYRSKLVVGTQDQLSYAPISVVTDTADNQFHDYTMAYADERYYFFKDKRQLCIIDEDELKVALDPQANDHNVYLENNIDKKQDDFLQAKSVRLNILIAKTNKEPPLMTIVEPSQHQDSTVAPNHRTGILYVPVGEPLALKGQTSSDAGIARVSVNGNDVDFDANGFFTFNSLPPPENLTLEIETNTGAKLTCDYQVKIMPDQPLTQHHYYPYVTPNTKIKFTALLFACADYDPKTRLDTLIYTIPDSKGLKKELESDYQFDVDLVENPKYQTVVDKIKKVTSAMTNEDNLIIAFSGHGAYRPGRSKAIGYWIPVDGVNEHDKYFSSIELDDLLRNCQARHIVILSNTCFSGALMGDGMQPNLDETESYKYRCVKVIAAGGIQEIPSGSPFLRYIRDVLKENAAKHTDDFIPDDYLVHIVQDRALKVSHIYPRIRSFGTSVPNTGTFFFIVKGAKPNFH